MEYQFERVEGSDQQIEFYINYFLKGLIPLVTQVCLPISIIRTL